VINGKKSSGTEIALPSLSWNFTEIVHVDGRYIFNITCIPDSKKVRWSNLQFRNIFGPACDDKGKCDNNNIEVKFDVVLEKYQWVTSGNDVALALECNLNANDNDEKYDDNGNKVSINGAYFKFVDYAIVNGDPDKKIGVSHYMDGNKIMLVYSHFDGSIYHDPSLGIGDVVLVGWIVAGIVGGVVIISAAFIVFFLIYRKKYQKL
jgi:hypothetical protein